MYDVEELAARVEAVEDIVLNWQRRADVTLESMRNHWTSRFDELLVMVEQQNSDQRIVAAVECLREIAVFLDTLGAMRYQELMYVDLGQLMRDAASAASYCNDKLV